MIEKKELKKLISNAMLAGCDKVYARQCDDHGVEEFTDNPFNDLFNETLKEVCKDWAYHPITY